MKGSKRMSLTERVRRSGREAVVGLSPLLKGSTSVIGTMEGP